MKPPLSAFFATMAAEANTAIERARAARADRKKLIRANGKRAAGQSAKDNIPPSVKE